VKKVLAGIVGLFACGIIAFFGVIFALENILPTYQHFQLWQHQYLITQSLPLNTNALDFDFKLLPPGAGNYCLVDMKITLQSDLDESALSTHFAALELGIHEILVEKIPNSESIYKLHALIANGAYCP